MEAVKAGQEFHAACFVGGRVHLGGQQLSDSYGEVVVNAHPLQEGFSPHGDDFAGGTGFIGGGVKLLAGQYF